MTHSDPLVPTPCADLPLARQLELTEARSNAALVEARARLTPAVGAAWRVVAQQGIPRWC